MTDIALAASVRDWPDRLHRFLLDHGGGRLVDRVMGAEQAASVPCDVFIVDDVCSFLTPHLVIGMRQRGVDVVGVYAPEDSADAKRRLLDCGISDVIEADASPEEFLAKVRGALEQRPILETPERSATPLLVGVTGPSGGVGITETAIAVARSVSSLVPAVVADLDFSWPSVAQRLDLPVHPNVRTTLDHALHTPDRIESSIQRVGRLGVVAGRADFGVGPAITRHDVLTVFDALGSVCRVVVADLGSVDRVELGLLREFDAMIVVGRADPVGVARLIRTTSGVVEAGDGAALLVVLNGPRSGAFATSEARREVAAALPEIAISVIPFDRSIPASSWNGTVHSSRSYRRAVDSIAGVVTGVAV